MPSSSIRLTNAASENRGGGSVKCCEDFDRLFAERLAFGHGRKPARLVIIGCFVLAFLIQGQKAVELHDLAGGAQLDISRACRSDDVDRCALEFGGFHLARDGTIPDQLVEARLLAIDIFSDFSRRTACAGRPHRFVGLLRVFRLVMIFAR